MQFCGRLSLPEGWCGTTWVFYDFRRQGMTARNDVRGMYKRPVGHNIAVWAAISRVSLFMMS